MPFCSRHQNRYCGRITSISKQIFTSGKFLGVGGVLSFKIYFILKSHQYYLMAF
jgi:hypothetical protein